MDFNRLVSLKLVYLNLPPMTSSFFTYNKAKVLQALRFHFISRKEIKITIILVNVFALLSGILFFAKLVSPVAFLMASGLWFILMISFWFVLPIIIYRKSATFQDRFRVKFEDQDMELETARGSRSWPWTAFSEMMETPNFFHLYFNSRSFFLIPKDAFEGMDMHDVRHLLRTKIK